MSLIFSIIKIRIQLLWAEMTFLKLGFAILIIISIFGNGFIIARIIDTVLVRKASVGSIMQYLYYGVGLITLLSGFFPSFSPVKNIVSSMHPVSKLKHFASNIVFDFLSPFNLAIILTLIVMTLLSDIILAQMGIGLVLVFLSAYLLKRLLLQMLMASSVGLGKIIVWLGFFLSLLAIYVSFFSAFRARELLGLSILLIVAFVLESYYFRESFEEKPSGRSALAFSLDLSLLLNNKKLLIPIIAALSFKALILFIAAGKQVHIQEKENAAMVLFFIFLFSSPLLIFTYVFNNLWGHTRVLWYEVEKTSGYYLDTVIFYVRLLFPVVLIDFSISLAYFMMGKTLFAENLAMYIVGLFVLIVVGLFGSLTEAKLTEKVFSMSANTSIVYNIFSGLIIGSMYLFRSIFGGTMLIYIALSFYVIVTAIVLPSYKESYAKGREQLFLKLFSSK